MHLSEYVIQYSDTYRKTGHPISESRQTQIGGVSLTYQTCKCGVKSRV